MSNKPFKKLCWTDQQIRKGAFPRFKTEDMSEDMFDGVMLTIRFRRGFEIFNTRPYHNYEDWGDGYEIETYDGQKFVAEDLDDAIKKLVAAREQRRVEEKAKP